MVGHIVLGLCLFFSGLRAHAQTPEVIDVDAIDTLDLETLVNIQVVTASKLKQKQHEAPSIISVIPRERFEEYGWFTLNDALYAQAGFFSTQDYDRRVVGSRGLFEGWNNNHILHLVDGVPMNDPMYGSAYTWENTPTFMIKNVEIIRGPGSALYGSNATNGVIAVQTLSGSDLKGKGQARFRAGSFDTTHVDAWTGNVAGNFNYFVGFSTMDTSGFEYFSNDASGRLGQAKTSDKRSARYMMLKIEGENELKGLSLQYHDQSWGFQTGHGWLFMIPDYKDSMKEHRRLLTASYKKQYNKKFSSEITLKAERKEIDWNTRYAPDGVDAGFGVAPNGIWEYANFYHDNYFLRTQGTLNLKKGASFLLGVEGSQFNYRGDEAHFSNTDLAGGTYAPIAGGGMANAPPILGLIEDRPILNLAAYAQYVSGNKISKRLPVTLGLRYDTQRVRYRKDRSNLGGTGDGSRTFEQLNPRLGVVYIANDKLSFKLLAGKAFRAPAPSELAGFGTWALANNFENLKPEEVTTYEIGADWHPSASFTVKSNIFYTIFKDQIGYSGTTNLSTNIYTTDTGGIETEVNYIQGKIKTFANASYAQRFKEVAADASVAPSKNDVTWAPWLTLNVGVLGEVSKKVRTSLQTRYTSEIDRKSTDIGTNHTTVGRASSIDSWIGLDGAVHYSVGEKGELSLFVKNLLDDGAILMKPRDNTFDYQTEGRAIYVRFTQGF